MWILFILMRISFHFKLGKRKNPWFKPSITFPEMLISTNYLMHPAIRRSVLLDVGMFDSEMDGAQDWDLFLRIILKTNKIAHIPKILYHWREIPGSVAKDPGEKPYALEAQHKAINKYLSKVGVPNPSILLSVNQNHRRVVWKTKGETVSIVIFHNNRNRKLINLVSSIEARTNYKDLELIVLGDFADENRLVNKLKNVSNALKIRSIECLNNKLKSYNLGAHAASGKYIVFFK